jgi:hypothetical protein
MPCRGITFVASSKNFRDPAQKLKISKAQATSEKIFPSSTNHNFSEDKISNQILKWDIYIFMKEQMMLTLMNLN